MVVNQDQDDEDSGSSMGFNWKLIAVMAAICIICYLSFTDDRLCSEKRGFCYYTWIVYSIVINMGIFMMQMSYIWMKYKSAQFVGNNIHGSITYKPPISAGNFYMHRLGGVGAFNIEGREGTAIYPKEAYNPLGSQVAVPCRFEKRRINQLDLTVQEKIREADCPKPYYYGDIDETAFDLNAEDIKSPLTEEQKKKLEDKIGSLNKMNPAMLHLYLRHTNEFVSKYQTERDRLIQDPESIVKFAQRIGDAASHVGGIRRIIPKGREDQERG